MISLRLAREYTYQLHHAGEYARLANALVNIPVFMALYRGETEYDVLRLWARLRERGYEPEPRYRESLQRHEADRPKATSFIQVLERVGDVLERLSCWSDAIDTYRQMLALAEQDSDQSSIAKAEQGLGDLLRYRGEY